MNNVQILLIYHQYINRLKIQYLSMAERKILSEQPFDTKSNIIKFQSINNHFKTFETDPPIYSLNFNTINDPYQNKQVVLYQLPELKTIPSSESIEEDIQSHKNIINAINSDIDDLFKKMSQLSNSLQLDVEPNSVKNVESKTQKKVKIKRQFSPNLNIIIVDKEKNALQNRNLNGNLLTGLCIRDFEIGKLLGYGKFGQTLQAKHRQTGTLYAIKKIFKSTIKQYNMQKQIYIQLSALSNLNHPNIVQGYGVFTDQFHIFILMEYAVGISLIESLNLCQKETSKILKQVLQAIKHMHSKGIVHRDIKPENIIVSDYGIVKICDFGWASVNSQDLNIVCGTLDYISPQMLDSKDYSALVDLWSVGVLTYELIFGKAPFKSKDSNTLKYKVRNIQFDYPQNTCISDQCKDFIEGFLKLQNQRENIEWGLKHKFIVKHQQISQQLWQQNEADFLN